MGDDMAALIVHLNLGKADVMGYSLGASVALQTAIRHPDVVDRLVLVSAAMKQDGFYPEGVAAFKQLEANAATFGPGVNASPLGQAYPEVDWTNLFRKVGDLTKRPFDWRADVARLQARTLLVFADSLSYYGPTGGLPADDPRIWPNLVASQLGWDMELIGRIGWTCRDIWWAATQDPRAWAALPRAGAVIFATGGMDSLPSVLPTALRELIRYVRPPWLRRWVRDGYGWLQPRLSPVARSALPPHLSADYLEQTRGAIDFNRPGIPIVASLPSVHIADTYGKAHHGRAGTVAAIADWADQYDVPLVDLKAAVGEQVMSGRGNPDGIHWNFEAHQAVAELMLKALAQTGVMPEKPRG